MFVVISYDVSTETAEGRARLRKIAKICQNYGQRVQKSVFECDVDPAQWVRFRAQLLEVVNLEEDSLRFYFLGKNWRRRVEHHGVKMFFDPDETMII